MPWRIAVIGLHTTKQAQDRNDVILRVGFGVYLQPFHLYFWSQATMVASAMAVLRIVITRDWAANDNERPIIAAAKTKQKIEQ